jgi:signal transduction histidine kinase
VIDERPGILVVDDRPENLVALSASLVDLGAEVVTAGSGNEALRKMLTRRFSVVLLDVQMPEMDGFEAAELMRTHEAMRTTPLIFVTAINKDEQHVFRGYAMGAVDYIAKPINPDILRSKVSVFLALHRSALSIQELERERQAARNLEALGVLAAGMAHDFNNLLAAITANVSGLPAAIDLAPGESDPRDDALQGCRRARDLVRELLHLAPGFGAQAAAVAIRELVEAGLAPLARRPGVEVTVALAEGLPPVTANREQLVRVVENLAMNAAEAMPGGGSLRVEAALVGPAGGLPPGLEPRRYVRLTLTDGGVGIPPELLPRVFDPYFTTKPLGSRKGTGLGLAVCDSIVRKLGGAIRIDSAPGRGTTVQLHLPAV